MSKEDKLLRTSEEYLELKNGRWCMITKNEITSKISRLVLPILKLTLQNKSTNGRELRWVRWGGSTGKKIDKMQSQGVTML